MFALGGVLPDAFTGDSDVIDRAGEIWPLFCLMQPFNGAVFALDGILIGAGDTRFLMWGMLAASLGAFAPIALLSLELDWGIVGRVVRPAGADRRAAGHVRRALRRARAGRWWGRGSFAPVVIRDATEQDARPMAEVQVAAWQAAYRGILAGPVPRRPVGGRARAGSGGT